MRGRRLVIADGTDARTVVIDVRPLFQWQRPTAEQRDASNKEVIFHHTASLGGGVSGEFQEVPRLQIEAQGAKYGLPYNFIVMPWRPWRIYYLCDVDSAWPHTYGHNDAIAIAAWGHYQYHPAPPQMVGRMLRVADALEAMWGYPLVRLLHRQVGATVCPGDSLASALGL